MGRGLEQALVLSLGTVRVAKAEHVHGLQCGHAATVWSSIDSASQRYAPDRAVDIEQFDLDVTPDFKNRRVAGPATVGNRLPMT